MGWGVPQISEVSDSSLSPWPSSGPYLYLYQLLLPSGPRAAGALWPRPRKEESGNHGNS